MPAMSSSGPVDNRSSQTTGWLAAVLLGAALVLGGGGSPAPLPELLLEWLAIAIAAAWLLLPSCRDDWRRVPRTAWLVAGLALALPALQLIPLPAALWQALPGREIEVEALGLIGREGTWRSWSMAPDRTLASLLSLLVPLAVLVMATTLDARQRLRLVWLVVIAGLASLLLGALQLAAAPDSPVQLYGISEPQLRGFQANHNSTADILLAAMVGFVLALRSAAERRQIPDTAGPVLGTALGGIVLFGFGVALTASRMGILLFPLALLASAWLLRRWLPRPGRKQVLAGAGAVILAALLGVALLHTNPILARIGQRFDFSEDLRAELWKDGLYVARKHYPVGVGMGNFVPALIADERLEVVRPAMPNRAHNEYIELAAEAGLPGLAAWAVIIMLVARGAWTGRRAGGTVHRAETLFAASVLALLMLHSMVDYPFRSMSLASLGALCAAILLVAFRPATGSSRKDHV